MKKSLTNLSKLDFKKSSIIELNQMKTILGGAVVQLKKGNGGNGGNGGNDTQNGNDTVNEPPMTSFNN